MTLRERAIEAMARALYELRPDRAPNMLGKRVPIPWDRLAPIRRGVYRVRTTAALTVFTALLRDDGCKVVAMEASEAMLIAGYTAAIDRRGAYDIWATMYDAALDPLEPTP